MKYGLPIKPVQLDNVRRFAGYLDDCRFLILSYEYIKPEAPDVNASLISWVRAGGTLLYIGDGSDPFHGISSWWRQSGYGNPAEHLFEMAGMERSPKDGEYPVGQGRIVVWNMLPARLCLNRDLAGAYRELVREGLKLNPDPAQRALHHLRRHGRERKRRAQDVPGAVCRHAGE